MSDPIRPTIIGSPMYPTGRDTVHLVEGTLGNPIFVSREKVDSGGDFFILFAANREKSPAEVARLLSERYSLSVRSFRLPGDHTAEESGGAAIEIDPDAASHYHMLDSQVRDALRFRPDLDHLAFKYGDNAEYFMISCRFRKGGGERLFDESRRRVATEEGQPASGEPASGEPARFLNTRKFDLLFSSAQTYVGDGDEGVIPDVIHRGGLAIYDRSNPDGAADDFHVARLSDVHVARDHDRLNARVVKRGDAGLTLRFSNPNDHFGAVIEQLNRDYRAGKVDVVVMMGDNVDHDGTDHQVSSDLASSNTLLLAHFLRQIEAPVVVLKGNHDSLAEAPPGSLMAENYQITVEEANSLQRDRYYGVGGIPIASFVAGQGQKLADSLGSVLYNPLALRPYYHLINPFDDMHLRFDWNAGQTSLYRSLGLALLDTGPNDLAHWRQDDPIYYGQLQKLWPWQLPFLHPESIIDFITGRSPDLHGPSRKQLTWLGGLSFQYLFGHAPLIDSKSHEMHAEGKDEPIRPLQDAGSYEENNFGTFWHNGPELVSNLLNKPEFNAYVGGHGHKNGHGGLIGVDGKNHEKIFSGQVVGTLNRLPSDPGGENLRFFWRPDDRPPPQLWEGLKEFFGEVSKGIRNHKFYWQAGSSTVGTDPVYAVMTINPDGLLRREEYFYPVKGIERDESDSSGNRYRVSYKVSDEPLGDNRRLITEWDRIRGGNPFAVLDFGQIGETLKGREEVDTADIVPHPNALKRFTAPIEGVTRPLIADTKINRHYRLRALLAPGVGDGRNVGVRLERAFSQYELGYIGRSVLMEGIEAGWFRDEEGTDRFDLSWVSPEVFDWHIPAVGTIRGVNFSIGPEVTHNAAEGTRFRIHNEMKIVEAARRFGPWELSLGIRKPDIFVGDQDEVVYSAGLHRAF